MRVRDKTKRKISNAMMELIKKKNLDKITITDITVECDITRQSFYRYFDDKYALINWVLEEDCGSIIYTGEEKFSINYWLKYILTIIEEKKDFYIHVVKEDSTKSFEKLLLRKTRFYIKNLIEYKEAKELTKQLEFLVEMTSRSLVDMIIYEINRELPVQSKILCSWLENGLPKTIAKLIDGYEIPLSMLKKWNKKEEEK